MASIAAASCVAAPVSLLQRTVSTRRTVSRSVRVAAIRKNAGVVCSAEEVKGLPKMAAAVTSAITLAASHPALALVDERLSTEGAGLKLGINSSSLALALLGGFGFIWSLYFVYSSKLPEGNDDSGLGL